MKKYTPEYAILKQDETLVGIYCKLEIYIINFCLIIQLARWSCQEADKQSIDATIAKELLHSQNTFVQWLQQVQVVMGCSKLNQQQRQLLIKTTSIHTARSLTDW